MVYLDYAAGFEPNPSSKHALGIEAKKQLETARSKAKIQLNAADNDKIVFTANGTESINLAILGTAKANKGKHIITTKIEHPAVLNTCKYLETTGYDVTYLDVDKEGLITAQQVQEAIKEDTFLITIGYANSEIGTIQPIQEIAKIKGKVLFHTDASQLCSVNVQGIDLLTLNGSKLNGSHSALLYVKEGVQIEPIMFGGNQEYGLRPGTENLSAIISFVKALDEDHIHVKYRDYFITRLTSLPNITLNGHSNKRICNNVNIIIKDVDAETLLNHLSEKGIFASAGSACTANVQEPSHVLKAIGLSDDEARSSIRFSLGKETTKEELDEVVEAVAEIVKSLRAITQYLPIK